MQERLKTDELHAAARFQSTSSAQYQTYEISRTTRPYLPFGRRRGNRVVDR